MYVGDGHHYIKPGIGEVMRQVNDVNELFQAIHDEHSTNLRAILQAESARQGSNQLQVLINSAFPNKESKGFEDSDLALNYTIRTGHYRRAVVLLEFGADLSHSTDHDGKTAFEILADHCINLQRLKAIKLMKYILSKHASSLHADARQLITLGKRSEKLKKDSKKWPASKIYATVFSLSVALFDAVVSTVDDAGDDVGPLRYISYALYVASLGVSLGNLYDSHNRLRLEEKDLVDVNGNFIAKSFSKRRRGCFGGFSALSSLLTKSYALFWGPSGACNEACNAIMNNLGPLLFTSSIELCTSTMDDEAAYLEDRTTFGA